MPDFKVSNHLLGDKTALDAAFARDGYLFFRDVVDREILGKLAQTFLSELKAAGVVDPDAKAPIHNRSNARIDYDALAGMRLKQKSAWVEFVDHPGFVSFVEQVIGGKARRLPVAETRMIPPDTGDELNRTRFFGEHQDGFFNEGYRFFGCWVPIWDGTRATGGLAVAEGSHRRGLLHDTSKPPEYPIPRDAVADSAWRTIDYRAGDLLMFDHKIVHSGLRNRSADYFRVSIDVRFLAVDDPGPIDGTFVSVSGKSLTIKDSSGTLRTFPFDAAIPSPRSSACISRVTACW
jgi:ectoine hydroxylase-related dioxygenase (phytanoyl-CoA dioxygenase family)